MKTYKVTIAEMVECYTFVEADSEKEAEELVNAGEYGDTFGENTVGFDVIDVEVEVDDET